jgi:nitrate/nitrite transporter NarK
MTPETAGLMIGIITFVGMQCGFIAPLVVGWIESQTGSLKEGILFFGVFGLLMAVLPIFLDETGQAQDSLSQSERNIN